MDHPIGLHLPSKVFCALVNHAGEGFYGPKTETALSNLVQHWIATTGAAPRPWLDDEDLINSSDPNEPKEITPPAAPGGGNRAIEEAAANPPKAPTTNRGYQWKQLFLPNGTELRAIYCGRSSYAQVENERIMSDGEPTTPSRLANARGCGTRNAWQAIWLCFPDSTRWQRAITCR